MPSRSISSSETGGVRVLKERRDFVAASKSGYKGVSFSLIIQMNPSPSYGVERGVTIEPCVRYGLTATKKTTGIAVQRNKSRRRMRNLVRDFLSDLGEVGCDYVLIARHNTATVSYSRLVKDFHSALRRSHSPSTGEDDGAGKGRKGKRRK